MKKTLLIGATAFAVPMLAFAQETPNFSYFADLLGAVMALIEISIPILIGAALLVFFWGLFNYVRKPEETKTGKNVMIAGLVGLFIMVSVWGIIRLGQGVLNVNNDIGDIKSPTVPRW